jgi:hypothetical protein
MKSNKEKRENYKSMKFRAGIFGIVNKKDDSIFLKASPDLDRAFNSDRFQLKMGSHMNRLLQNDWNSLGEENFDFLIIDELETKGTETSAEIKKELTELLGLHLAELKQKGTPVY